jgi:hypothetical protein
MGQMRALVVSTKTLIVLILIGVACSCGPAVAADPVLESLTALPEEGLPDGIRGVLADQGHRVLQDGEGVAEFWLCREQPEEAMVSGDLGVEFAGLQVGQLVGVVHFPRPWRDYRDAEIAPGLYTLRYGVQPADGDHMGVAEYRDYLLLLPAAQDQNPDQTFTQQSLNEASQAASRKVHPAILALFPVWEEVAEPRLVHNDIGQSTLALKVGEGTMGLVILGHGELE